MRPYRLHNAVLLKVLLAFVIAVPFTSALAGVGDDALRDSLLSTAGSEPTLQEIFDSLGYDIDVANDELGWERFCASGEGNVAILLDEISTSYYSASAGWYDADDSTDKAQLFGPSNEANDSITFTALGEDFVGFYFIPGISGGYTWYTNPAYNRDLFDHAKVFATGQNAAEYIVAFEDLKGGGDQDFNDLILKVRFAKGPPIVVLPADTSVYVCAEEGFCFDITAFDGDCGDSGGDLEIRMVRGPGDFPPVTGPSPLTATHCIWPYFESMVYTFVFKATNGDGLVGYDTLVVDYNINQVPELVVPEDFDTVICSNKPICFTVSGSDPDGDEIEYELLHGPGVIDPVTGEICFTPAEQDSADYMFVIRAADSCCAAKEDDCFGEPNCPPQCPIDTVVVTVLTIAAPYFVYVPVIDTTLCEPATICFPVTAESPIGRPVTIEAEPPATYNEQTGEVCLYVDADGLYEIEVTASDQECGEGDVDTARITVTLNSPPTVDLGDDTTLTLCQPGEYCFTATAYDPDGDPLVFVLESGPGVIDPQTGEVCFTPPGSGSYEFIVSVSDTCPAMDVDSILIEVLLNSPPEVYVPDTAIALCEIGEVCFFAEATDPDPGEALTFSLSEGPGSINPSTGEICFTPAGEGDYQFVVSVSDKCDLIDVDTGTVAIGLNKDPVILLESLDTLFWCELGDSVCFAVEVDDPDAGQELTVEQLAGQAGAFNSETGEFCFLPAAEGTYQFTFRVVDICGAADTAETERVIVVNENPVVTLPDDFAEWLCDAEEVCFPVTIEDDGEVEVIVSPIGSYAAGEVCFTPEPDSTYCIIVRAVDICGSFDEDTVCIEVTVNNVPDISLGPDQTSEVCKLGDTVCFPYTASDPDGEDLVVTVFSGNGIVKDGEICFVPNEPGTFYFVVRATDACGEFDSDDIFITVTVNNPPELFAHDDDTVLLCDPEQVCFENYATDPDSLDDLTFEAVSGIDIIFPNTGTVCFTPLSAGDYQLVLRVVDDCGVFDQDTINIHVVFNSPPSITGTNQQLQVNYCEEITDPGERCFFGIEVSDDDAGDVLTVSKISGPGVFYDNNLRTCFTPAQVDSTYEFCYRVSDNCGDFDEVCIDVDVVFVDSCVTDTSVCLTVSIEETAECAYNSSEIVLNIFADVQEAIGGFDLLIEYDVTGFTFLTATPGPGLAGWEYFTFRYGPTDGCGGPCPDGLLRFVAITDINNGAAHPPPGAFYPEGSIVRAAFRVTGDVNFGGLFFPVRFFWVDCGDNSFSSIGGDSLFIDKLILNHNGIVWDELDDFNYPEIDRLRNIGAPDSCAVGGKVDPVRCVIFENGGICIISPDSIDLRGDINLNDIAYEIGDVVLFTNYFIWGLRVLNINQAGQIAATDVNADGATLTVGDLVYLIRVLTGDALPIQKLSPYANHVNLEMQRTDSRIELLSESSVEIGASYMVFDFDPAEVTPGAPILTDETSNMSVNYSIEGGTMKVLVYSYSMESINSGINSLVTIEVEGDGALELVRSEFSDYDGNQLRVNEKTTESLPEHFTLSQNYPNPFNPETEFELYLPYPSEWDVQIFNVTGQMVENMSGYSGSGVVKVRWNGTDFSGRKVASGIYFYKATAGKYSETRKMVLLK